MEQSLYGQDFFRWTQQQADELRRLGRAGANLPLDWENLAEEVESLGRSEQRELRSRLSTIIEHLLKLEFSSATDPRADWMDTVDRERQEIVDGLLVDSPSLRSVVEPMIARETRKAAGRAARSMARHGELDEAVRQGLLKASYSEEQVLGDWFPNEPSGGHSS